MLPLKSPESAIFQNQDFFVKISRITAKTDKNRVGPSIKIQEN